MCSLLFSFTYTRTSNILQANKLFNQQPGGLVELKLNWNERERKKQKFLFLFV